MPEEIVTRILRLPGYGVYAWEAEEETHTLTLAIRQTAREPYYVCGGCGISVRYVHSWTERRIRDLNPPAFANGVSPYTAGSRFCAETNYATARTPSNG